MISLIFRPLRTLPSAEDRQESPSDRQFLPGT
jgi:hypothetical protein